MTDARLRSLTPDQFNDGVYCAADIVRYADLHGIPGVIVRQTRCFDDRSYIIGAVRHEVRSRRARSAS